MEQAKRTGYPSVDRPWLKYYSEEAKHAKQPEGTVYDYLYDSNRAHLDEVALEYFGRKTTYGQMFARIEAAAKAFWQCGVRSGDVVAFCTVTTPETVYAFYGLNRLGAVANMIDPRTNADRIRQYLQESKARVIVVIDAAYPKIAKLIGSACVEAVIVVSAANAAPFAMRIGYRLTQGKPRMPLGGRCVPWNAFVAAGRSARAAYAAYRPNTPAAILHTGGTTGTPKGVVLSNDNFNTMVVFQKYARTRMQRGNSFLGIMPPFIAYGLVCGINNPLCLGLRIILIPKFDPQQFAALVVKHKPNHALGVPSYWESLAKSEGIGDLSFLENAITGGDGITPSAEEAVNTFFKAHGCRHKLSKGYGMTELSSTATYSVCDACNPPESVGIPLFWNNVKIVEPGTQKELPYRQQGEICLTSPTMMLGYYRNEEETRRTLLTHDDGVTWIHSGDIGYMDEDGVLFLVGRSKRVIPRPDGHKVWPSQIESVLSEHPAVAACAVVGLHNPDGENGRIPTAFVVLKDGMAGSSALIDELDRMSKARLPERDVALAYHFIDALPLTPIGKVDYRALERMGAEDAAAR